MTTLASTRQRFYPEIDAGGFSRVDGTVAFYQRINALITPDAAVLDIGAGRGVGHLEDPVPYRRGLRNFKGRVSNVTGIDVDSAVLGNPSLDTAAIINNDIFPVADASIDLAFSDFTLEHVSDAAAFESETRRVLRSGGWFCARTPNKNGYISIASRLIPERHHTKVLSVAQPNRKPEDVFPAMYRLNTSADLKRHFDARHWDHFIYTHKAEPAYFGASVMAWRLARACLAVTPPAFWPTLFIFMRKR
ncbi:MAG: class I SAM-dependent methyltransferase [Devosia sp.]